eukprot:5686403-Ditylum_brightwellii.AAC.1
MGGNCQATAWQLTPISNSRCVLDLGGFCCVLLGQNKPSKTQQASLFFHKNNDGSDNKKNILFVAPATPLQGKYLQASPLLCIVGGLCPLKPFALALKGRNLGCQWQPTTHLFVTPLLFPCLPLHLLHQYDAPDASLTRGEAMLPAAVFPVLQTP